MSDERLSPGSITVLLRALAAGEQDAYPLLWGRIYGTVRQIARRRFRQRRDPRVLQPTELVNEVFLELSANQELDLQDSEHLWRHITTVMANFRVDETRRLLAKKRGGNLAKVDLPEELRAEIGDLEDIVAVHEALKDLEATKPPAATAAQLAYMAGFTQKEIAKNLSVTERSVRNYLSFARGYLGTRLGGPLARR